MLETIMWKADVKELAGYHQLNFFTMNEEQLELNLYDGVSVVDLFCGIGGLTYGLIQSRLNVVAGVDLDKTCTYAYEANNQTAEFIPLSISEFTAQHLLTLYPENHIKILVGCAPCQPFSNHRNKEKKEGNVDHNADDERYGLLGEFLRLIREVEPEIVSMENVPQVRNYPVFREFVEELNRLGYYISDYTNSVYCPDYGIPQKRERLVLLASKIGPISLVAPTHQTTEYRTVAHAIRDLEPIADGEICANDSLHRARKLSDTNLKRIRAIRAGQSWRDLSEDLISPCHKKENGKTFTGPYSRMTWEELAPTMTTHCIGFSNGRFGHPEQDRAISLREAALIQSFPRDYQFIEDEGTVKVGALARHIGNAVPPNLAAAIGLSITNHLTEHNLLLNNG